ncbi:hypothetical protein PQG02_11945 [Nostoc sp. UHCC 0926]|uniref:hypothetical protein n=1 Tax=unclassified Nostoc TaxID=2593658 RepID=UPI00235E86A8|nr:hypothetical protein [Nostoc sp. UHCC 0926]WDD34976.1 hypothetical protein PQG02_11945 [Nostoc sp. UHCC 0926]
MEFGEVAWSSPYSPSPKEDALAFGHPTAGASLWQCEKGSHCGLLPKGEASAKGFPQVEQVA